MQKHQLRSLLLLAAAVALVGVAPCEAAAEPDFSGPAQQLRLRSGPAIDTLHEFSLQTHVDLLSNFDILSGIETTAVSGRLTPVDALTQMLEGTGLTYVAVGKHMVVIKKAAEAALAKTPGPPAPQRGARASGKGLRSSHTPSLAPQIEEVLVQGSMPLTHEWPGSRAIVFTMDDIDGMGGLTVPDFLRSQPEIFGGGPSEDTQIGAEARTNIGQGSGLNLRGLDAGATLILINGRRMAPSGWSGAFSDVANVPLSAIQRIEIVPEGAGIDYGADAPGGVVNLVMRNDFRGGEAQAWFGGATDGTLQEHRYSLAFGGDPLSRWGPSTALLIYEHYDRDALPASDRRNATSNYSYWGGPNLDGAFGNPGNIRIGDTFYPIPDYQSGTGLTAAQLSAGSAHRYDENLGATVLPSQRRDGLLASLTFAPGEHFKWFADAVGNSRSAVSALPAVTAELLVPSTNPYYVNPTGGTDPVAVEYGFLKDLGPQMAHVDVTTSNSAAGVNWGFGRWRGTAYVSYASESDRERITGQVDPIQLIAAVNGSARDTAFNPFGDGSYTNPDVLDPIRAQSRFVVKSAFTSYHLDVSGPLFSWSGRSAMLTAGAEYRDQSFITAQEGTAAQGPPRTDLGRSVVSTFAQASVPLVSPDFGWAAIQRLDLSLAWRWDRYSDAGKTGSPALGLAWTPVDNLVLRGTWAQSFRAPDLPDRVEALNVSIVEPIGTTSTLLWNGNNADLRPETAHTWTVGATWTPSFMRDTSLALTFFDIAFKNRIEPALEAPDSLADLALAGRVTIDPTQAQLANVCNRSTFVASGPFGDCPMGGIGAIVDLRFRNAAVLRSRGIDFLGTAERATAIGKFALRLQGTYLLNYSLADAPESAAVSLLNTPHNPLNLHLSGSASWTRGNLTLGVLQNYSNGYRGSAGGPQQSLHSWLTTDVNVSYALQPDWLPFNTNSKVFLRVANIFDRYPAVLFDQAQTPLPLTDFEVPIGYDRENADLLGRFVTGGVRVQW